MQVFNLTYFTRAAYGVKPVGQGRAHSSESRQYPRSLGHFVFHFVLYLSNPRFPASPSSAGGNRHYHASPIDNRRYSRLPVGATRDSRILSVVLTECNASTKDH